MDNTRETEDKPCSVQARQGFSVFYRKRYLYSQYDAEKPVNRLIDSLTILPETLVLAYSPALGTGLLRLLDRLPQGAAVLAVEFDRELYDFFMNTPAAKAALADARFSAVLLDRPEQIASLIADTSVRYRRCLPVEMSGGTSFNQEAYRLTTMFADDAVATFWKNHITLTRMGRLYAKNLFTNTAKIKQGMSLKPHSVSRTFLALGAGPSLDELLPELSGQRENFFILAADAALPALSQHNLLPDAVVAVESQLAIEKAYIGFEGSGIPLIADMTSRPRVISIMNGPVAFFMTEYCREPFIGRFKKLAEEQGIPVFQPLGSVGLYALELALYLRTQDTPVCFSGLDFSWGKGSTHCKGAPAHTNALLNTTRLNPVGNPAAAFAQGTYAFTGKDGATGYSTPNLSGYAKLLAARYGKTTLLFDAGNTGIETGIQRISIENMLSDAKKRAIHAGSAENDNHSWMKTEAPDISLISEHFLADEYAALKQIAALIDERKAASEAASEAGTGTNTNAGSAHEQELITLLKEHSYLFLHFPDAARGPSLTPDFLARVKLEAARLLAARR